MALSFGTIANFFSPSSLGTLANNFKSVLSEFSRVIYRDGSATMQGNLDMNSNRLINLGPGVSNSDAATVQQLLSVPKGADGSPGGNVLSTGPFTSLAAQVVPTGTTLIQTSGSTRGVLVEDTSLTNTDVTAFPRTITKTANGRYFRRDEAVVSMAEVGANGSPGSTGDWGAMQEALAYLRRFANSNAGIYRGTPRLKLAPYQRIDLPTSLKQTVIIEGDGQGLEGGQPSIVDCSAGAGIGFIVERADTYQSQTNVPVTTGADGSILRNFALLGTGTPTGQDDAAGVSLKARASVSNLYVSGFRGSGIRVVASATLSGDARGNANCFKLRDITVYNCFDGVYIQGDDANAGIVEGINSNSNARGGVIDFSTLGNTHIGHHTSGNGAGVSGRAVMVSYGGNRYAPLLGRDAYWSTIAPGTNAPDGQPAWVFFEPGGPIGLGLPTWTSGGSYMFGASYSTNNRNARSVFVGCYTEGTQAPPQISWPSLAIGGLLGQKGDGIWLNGEQQRAQALGFQAGGAFIESDYNALRLTGGNVPDFRMKPVNGVIRGDFGNQDAYHPFNVHGPGTTDSAMGANAFEVTNRLGLPGHGACDGFSLSAPTYDPKVPTVVFSSATSGPNGWRNPGGTTTWTSF